jgi:16S rRNA (adenine1518-N6/adenine1519-N6)-dimethyltransferase
MSLFQPSELFKFLNSIHRKPNKRLSQNFLIDGNIVKKIVASGNITPGDIVIEIGPGPGVLTEALLQAGAHVIAVEKDEVFARELSRLEKKPGQLEVFEDDVLKFPLVKVLQDRLKSGKKAKVIANLPYHLTSPIFDLILPQHSLIDSVVVMIQKEVAERIVSKSGTKNFSAFSIFCQFYSHPELLFPVSPNCFFPKPKVTSAVIKCSLYEPRKSCDTTKFFDFIKLIFHARRKMLTSSLKGLFDQERILACLEKCSIDPKARPEEVPLESLILLFEHLYT